MNDILFKPGDNFDGVGTAAIAGVDDFTGWGVTLQVSAIDGAGLPTGAALGVASGTWLDALAGIFSYSIAAATTANWPVNARLAVDVKFTSPGGEVTTTETNYFRTSQRVPAA